MAKAALAFIGILGLIQTSRPQQQQLACFVPGECQGSFEVPGKDVDDKYQCRKACQSSPYCNWFTFYGKTNFCQLHRNCLKLDNSSCSDCLSGVKDCSIPQIKCWLTGRCQGDALTTNPGQTSEDCLTQCQASNSCKHFTFDDRSKSCQHFENCSQLTGCDSCVSGDSECSVQSMESEWHLIIGGAGSTKKVELFNWRTFKQCQLPDLPVGVYGHVAASFDGVPVFCEGNKGRRSCYKMDKSTRNWVSIASLIAGVEFGKSVFVPSIGWAIFGQLGNKLNRSQVLPTLDGEWQEGPELADPNAHKLNQCMFQINDFKTGFVHKKQPAPSSSRYDYYNNYQPETYVVKELDWSTMTYQEKKIPALEGNYFTMDKFPRCFVIRGDDDVEQLIVSGFGRMFQAKVEDNYTKVEASDPSLGPYNTLNGVLSQSFYLSQMTVVNNKTELVSYGGIPGFDTISDGIFKYSTSTNNWILVAKMLFPRSAPAVVPVIGLECP